MKLMMPILGGGRGWHFIIQRQILNTAGVRTFEGSSFSCMNLDTKFTRI